MTTFNNTNTDTNNGETMNVKEITKYMLIDVYAQKEAYQREFEERIQQALEELRKEVGDAWSEGAKNVLWEQLLYIAQPRNYKPNHEMRYVVEFAAIEQGDEDCEAWSKYRAWELAGTEQLEMYVHHLKGGDVIEWLRLRWERRKEIMRGEMRAWGYNFETCPVEDDDDLVEEHRRIRDWYYADPDNYSDDLDD
jgi:hypothetical protein